MLDDCVAKDVPNKVQPAEILWWGDKKTNNKQISGDVLVFILGE
jgi:hypothetical protein